MFHLHFSNQKLPTNLVSSTFFPKYEEKFVHLQIISNQRTKRWRKVCPQTQTSLSIKCYECTIQISPTRFGNIDWYILYQHHIVHKKYFAGTRFVGNSKFLIWISNFLLLSFFSNHFNMPNMVLRLEVRTVVFY